MTLDELERLQSDSEKWQAETLAELTRYGREELQKVLAELVLREDVLLTELHADDISLGSSMA